MLNAFCAMNRVTIAIVARVAPRKGKPDMVFSATACPLEVARGEAAPWGSVNAICWASEFKSLMGVYTTLLYRLDFAIGEREYASALKTAEPPPAH
jgi:hypothetical protein